MTKKSWFEAMGISLLMFSLGCSEGAPSAPSSLARNDFGAALGSSASTTDSYPVVTLEPDLRAHPATVYVQASYMNKVLMVNNTSRYVLIRSYNCSQFSSMGLQPGASRHTMAFYTAGQTCYYFASQDSKRVFYGEVVVQ